MKRICLSIFLVFITILLSVCAYAHSGRTDSNGGHYDHSTGEYHYHHGYGEHDHYDMDGDGDLDCPYEKKQQSPSYSTEHSSTNYPSSSNSSDSNFFEEFFRILLAGSIGWIALIFILWAVFGSIFKNFSSTANVVISIIVILALIMIIACINTTT